jgi:hypothetical protein
MSPIARRPRRGLARRIVRRVFGILHKILRILFVVASALGPGMPPPPPPPRQTMEQHDAGGEGLDER